MRYKVFFALLYNDEWFEDEQIFITIDNLKDLLKRKIFPLSPDGKLDNVFLKLLSYQKEDGEWVQIDNKFYDEVLWKILYFKSVKEFNYYIEVLNNKKLIEAQFSLTLIRTGLLEQFRVTFEGLSYEVKLRQQGDRSNKCFIAMAFKPETIDIRESIKQALASTGFEPLIVDEQNIESDRTINDEIIANLKRCKFCIADFSFHSQGVYFESGHALGQGKKVIYTCRKDEFAKAHFDIKPLQQIIYETTDELTKKSIKGISNNPVF